MNTPIDSPEAKATREAVAAALAHLQKNHDARVVFFACLVRCSILARGLVAAGEMTAESITRDFAIACNDALTLEGGMPKITRRPPAQPH